MAALVNYNVKKAQMQVCYESHSFHIQWNYSNKCNFELLDGTYFSILQKLLHLLFFS